MSHIYLVWDLLKLWFDSKIGSKLKVQIFLYETKMIYEVYETSSVTIYNF